MFPFNRVLANIRGFGRFSSPLRNSETVSFYRLSGYSLKSGVSGDFHRPYERRFPFIGVHTENFQLSIFPYFLRFEF